MILAGPIDWDDGLSSDLFTLVLIFFGAVLLLVVTAFVLLTLVTFALTYLRGRRGPD